MTTKGNGKSYRWLVEHQHHKGTDCLLWPFGLNSGYGTFGYLGKAKYAHRFMCELVNGPSPGRGYEASHNCGNRQCVNPTHLSWKTISENQKDRIIHGTQPTGKRGKLTVALRDEIRAQRGIVSQTELAKRYGVTRSCISVIFNTDPKPKVRGAVKEGSRWLARIRIKGQVYRLGKFDTEEEARAVYLVAVDRARLGLPVTECALTPDKGA